MISTLHNAKLFLCFFVPLSSTSSLSIVMKTSVSDHPLSVILCVYNTIMYKFLSLHYRSVMRCVVASTVQVSYGPIIMCKLHIIMLPLVLGIQL